MYLSREAILKAIDRGDINVSPFEPELLGAASLDLRLDRAFRRLEVTDSPLDLRERTRLSAPPRLFRHSAGFSHTVWSSAAL